MRAARLPAGAALRGLGRASLRADAMAGATAAAVVVPIAMAHASIAGVPVSAGLATVIVPMVAYAFLGSSRALSVSTTSTLAILVAASVAQLAPQATPSQSLSIASALAVLAGVALVAASVLRLGFVANFISHPVLTGFKAGIGVVIVVDQLPKLLGISIVKEGFFRDVWHIALGTASLSMATLAVGAAVIVMVLAGRRFAPALPAPLIAIALAIAASALLGLPALGVKTVGALHGGLPAFALPALDLAGELWAAALGIALMSFTETIASGRAFTLPGEPRPAADRELLATGAANLAGGFFGAIPCGGGTTQTAVNLSAGARSQAAALVTALIAACALLALAPAISLMPQAALAAVVLTYSVGLIKLGEFRAINAVRATEFQWALIAFAGVLVLGTLRGILVAIIASLLSLLYQANRPAVHVLGRKRGTDAFRARSDAHAGDESWPGLLILRPQGRLYFANAERVGDRMWALLEQGEPSVVLVDFSSVIDIEYTALAMLTAGEAKLAGGGIRLWVAGLNPEVLAIVRESPLGRTLGRDRMFLDVATAVAEYERTTGARPVSIAKASRP